MLNPFNNMVMYFTKEDITCYGILNVFHQILAQSTSGKLNVKNSKKKLYEIEVNCLQLPHPS